MQAHGWRIVDEFVDNDRSASRYARKVRPDFARVVELIDAGGARRIVPYSLDRLLPDPKELEELIDRADPRMRPTGTLRVTSLQGDIDLSSEDGRFQARTSSPRRRRKPTR